MRDQLYANALWSKNVDSFIATVGTRSDIADSTPNTAHPPRRPLMVLLDAPNLGSKDAPFFTTLRLQRFFCY